MKGAWSCVLVGKEGTLRTLRGWYKPFFSVFFFLFNDSFWCTLISKVGICFVGFVKKGFWFLD